MKTQDIAVIGICAALYAIVGILTANVSFFGIGFLPAVVIPAVFAVLYGPWVGGISGILGIFIRDMFVHGNAALSLAAGVPPNFILFFLIGYISHRNISLKQAIVGVMVVAFGLLAPTIILLPDITAYTGLSTEIFVISFTLTVILSLAVIAAVVIRWKEWRSYAIAAVVGQALGAGLPLRVALLLQVVESPLPAHHLDLLDEQVVGRLADDRDHARAHQGEIKLCVVHIAACLV